MANTKDRILTTSAELFRRKGYAGTGVKQIVAAANAPFGSLYHFFPGGKEQLGEEVIHSSGVRYRDLITVVFDRAPDVIAAVADFFDGAAETLVRTDYADACPIATLALEVANTSERLRQATADVFASWIGAMAERFEAAGMRAEVARAVAVCTLCMLEGAFVLSRSIRSTEPLELAGAAATAAIRSTL